MQLHVHIDLYSRVVKKDGVLVMSVLQAFLFSFFLVNSIGVQARGVFVASWQEYTSNVFEEDFEDWDLVSLDSDSFVNYVVAHGWRYNWSLKEGVPVIVARSLLRDGRSLKLFGNRIDLLSHSISVRSNTTRLVLEVVLRIDRLSDSNLSATVLGIADRTYATRGNLMSLAVDKFSNSADTMIVFAGDEFVTLQGMKICEFSTNTWYTLKIAYDLNATSSSIFLDGKLVQERELETSITGAYDPCFFIFSYNHSVLLDLVRMFEPQIPSVTLILNSNDGGTTSPTPQTLILEKGSSITIWAKPYDGYLFDHWVCNNTYQLTANPLHFEVNESLSITPVFSKIQPFYSEFWFWSVPLAITAITTSIICYIWFKRKIQGLVTSKKTKGKEPRPLVCPNCGCRLPKGAVFCGNCGFKLNSGRRKK